MIKGCSKRVIVVKNPKGDTFEEAYFIVKEGKYKTKRDTKSLVGEADKIINGEKKHEKRNEKALVYARLGNVFSFILGVVSAVVIFYLLLNF
jgi:uncharacterized membrane protein